MFLRALLASVSLASLIACSSSGSGDDKKDSNTDAGNGVGETQLTATQVVPSSPVSATYVAVLPNGNLVISDNTTPGLFELSPDGTVLASNTTDFAVGNTPGQVRVNAAGEVFVTRGSTKNLVQFVGGLNTAPQAYLTHAKNISSFAWGGAGAGKLFVHSGVPSGKLESYDAATANDAGAATELASIPGTITSMAVDAAGTAYLYDYNACRITRVKGPNDFKVIVGTEVGSTGVCALGEIQAGRVGQGGGLVVDAEGRLLFADTANDRILRITVAADDTTTITGLYTKDGFKPRQLSLGPTGILYAVDESDQSIWKLE